MLKTKVIFRSVILLMVLAIGYVYFIGRMPTDSSDEQDGPDTIISLMYQPNIDRNEQQGVQVKLYTFPGGDLFNRQEYVSPFIYHLRLARGQRVTLLASRIKIEVMECAINISGIPKPVSHDIIAGAGSVRCSYQRP
jgi:hypothetical protein